MNGDCIHLATTISLAACSTCEPKAVKPRVQTSVQTVRFTRTLTDLGYVLLVVV